MKNNDQNIYQEISAISLDKDNPEGIDRLLEFSHDEDALTRSEAFDRFSEVFNERLLKRNLECLDDPDDLVRVTCVENLTIWKHKDFADVVRKRLFDSDILVRVYAAEALAAFNDKPSIEKLKLRQIQAENDFERTAYSYALYILEEKEYFDTIIKAIHSDEYVTKIRFVNVYIPEIVNKNNKAMLLSLLQEAAKKEEPVSVEEALTEAIQKLKKLK